MLRRLVNNQRGAVIWIFALGFAGFCALSGLVVDVGYLYVEHARLQNAVDAASLAGASQLPSTAGARAEAVDYARQNGLNRDNVHVSFPNSNRVRVTYTENFQTFFMRAMNIALGLLNQGQFESLQSVNISVAAAAQKGGPGHAFDYTIFSGSPTDILHLNGNGWKIDGSVHSNQNLKLNGTNLTITDLIEAVLQITVNGNNISYASSQQGVDLIDMPDYSAQVQEEAEATGPDHVFNSSKTWQKGNGIDVDGNIYVNGSVQLNGNTIRGNGSILATGSIHTNGNNIHISDGGQVCYYSKNGDIQINGNNITIDGILYAPNGNIQINGNSITINGRIIGNTVKINGSNLTVNGNSNPVTSLPGGQTTQLVE